jgi:hypothetical protein
MSRRAVIRREYAAVPDDPDNREMFVVDLFEDNKLVQTRVLPDKSIHYAQDVVENWESGLIQMLTE